MLLEHLQSKKVGNAFEDILIRHSNSIGAKITQLPSGCKWIGKRAVSVKTEFDFVFAYQGDVVIFDAKTLKTGGFAYSAITPHQLNALYEYECQGIRAGYLIWFRSNDQVTFVKASALRALKPRCSLSSNDGLLLGSIRDFDLRTIINATRQKPKT